MSWTDIAGALVAFGTASLAVTTWRLAVATRSMAKQTQQMAAETARMADETRRVADASERALEQQIVQAEAATRSVLILEAQASDARRSTVVPLRWDGGLGLVFSNTGRSAARDVELFVYHGPSMIQKVRETIPSLSPGQHHSKSFDPASAPDAVAVDAIGEGRMGARITWTNEDGSPGDSGWVRVPSGG